ncbi:MAG TPA: bifunctional glutamate N-acetyltransferase/amino-acid acetyltransferase ArgJ [Candidatus Omnitrophota bacterium]|nr:bifunctional glutamate N-acetyltransferase/amino-acid acetyltransferase ArgJ [Candidatus Omnitrophota bacterium]HRZ15840.1 bifunctional glutamate N-acetyltransferase/amino-acid acetyltransferase ArgJ [Candidatus Omnitrophota bacterium]
MNILHKAVLPGGFTASGVACGLKKSGKPDLALIYSRRPALACGMFTTNTIPAAPVVLCRKHLAAAREVHAIVANSGNANCFTGKAGMADARLMTGLTARQLHVDPQQVLVGSTGIIGKRMNMQAVKTGIPPLIGALSVRGIAQAKKAIMTTDRLAKEITVRVAVGGATVTVCGIAKGAGMIAPNMATMLCFIMTDARISRSALEQAMRSAVDRSFNCITVDGCMSTNDTVIVMANGHAGNVPIRQGSEYQLFYRALSAVCQHLATMMVRDGEGASKCIRIRVRHARDFREAKTAALAIANSNLFKTAMFGENPNFGRIVASVGASGIGVREQDLKIKLGPLSGKDVSVDVSLSRGKAECTVYTSDLTNTYIKINAAYN